MSRYPSINETLAQIDEWALAIGETDLAGQAEKSGFDFFNFMVARGVDPAWLDELVRDFTGYSAKDLSSSADAEMLRAAISNYEMNQADVIDRERREPSIDIQANAEQRAIYWWKR